MSLIALLGVPPSSPRAQPLDGKPWTVSVVHSAAVLHVAIVHPGDLTTGRACHSVTTFITSGSVIVAHGASGQRLGVCGIYMQLATNTANENYSWVSGTGAACGTATRALLGAHTAALGLAVSHQVAGLQIVQPTTWIVTEQAGDALCLLKSGSGRITGTVIYGAY